MNCGEKFELKMQIWNPTTYMYYLKPFKSGKQNVVECHWN